MAILERLWRSISDRLLESTEKRDQIAAVGGGALQAERVPGNGAGFPVVTLETHQNGLGVCRR